VALTYALGRQLASRWTALAAAFLAAANPFQVYYSQEARMYMLLAVLSAGAALALARYVQTRSRRSLVALVLLESAGLYTHYAFAFVVVVVNLTFALALRAPTARRLASWAGAQCTAALVFLPWLPIAIGQLSTWPNPEQTTGCGPALEAIWRWLVFGPAPEARAASWPLAIAALAALAGALLLLRPETRSSLPSRWPGVLLAAWLGLPVALVLVLGLYREGYLKFLLVASPAVCLLLAQGLTALPLHLQWRGTTPVGQPLPLPARMQLRFARGAWLAGQFAAAALILASTALSLHSYYVDSAYARDDYRGMAAYIRAVGRPGDAVVLNAPGQQEVFGYYYHDELPVYPLPTSRPPDPQTTREQLRKLSEPGSRIFAVLWATGESDPDGIVEGWLNHNTYEAFDAWYGNVRLAIYSVPVAQPYVATGTSDVRFLDEAGAVTLESYALPAGPVAAGEIALIALAWADSAGLRANLKRFVHVLDEANHIVGQRDVGAGGGSSLPTDMPEGVVTVDRLGVPIHPATPPGTYRIEVGIYDSDSGARLLTGDGAPQVWLEPLVVVRPASPAPVVALGMQHAVGQQFGEFTLLGYDAHKLGFGHLPDVPLHPGDMLHVNLYWRAQTAPSGDWQVEIWLVARDGRGVTSLTGNPVVAFPSSLWQRGDVWRGQFDLPIPATAPAGQYRMLVQPVAPGGARPEPYRSDRLRIGP
jgi:hypothetical protein